MPGAHCRDSEVHLYNFTKKSLKYVPVYFRYLYNFLFNQGSLRPGIVIGNDAYPGQGIKKLNPKESWSKP